MIIKNFKTIAIFFILALAIFTSCDSKSDNESTIDEPILLENYFFRGTLDGQELNIERKV